MLRAIHADAIVVGDGTCLRDGAVVVDGARVVDVGAASDVLPRNSSAKIDRVRGLVAPGLVNAHTHLELSALRGATLGGQGFVPWLSSMLKARAEIGSEEGAVEAAIDREVARSVELGVVAIGEVTNSLAATRSIGRSLLGTIFHEQLGLDRAAAFARLESIEESRAIVASTSRDFIYAPTPHALYSTHPDLVRALVARAREATAPLSIHLAEHAAERAFLFDGSGPMAEFVRGRPNATFTPTGLDPIAYAESLGLLDANAALVHLADARPEELDRLEKSRSIVILCPRSNLHIETKLPPLVAIRSRGIAYAIATDSLASAPSLDPLADARALHDRFPNVPAIELVSATMHVAARAIGWGDRLGLIAKGRAPGLLHVALDVGDDPARAWLRALDLPRDRLTPALSE